MSAKAEENRAHFIQMSVQFYSVWRTMKMRSEEMKTHTQKKNEKTRTDILKWHCDHRTHTYTRTSHHREANNNNNSSGGPTKRTVFIKNVIHMEWMNDLLRVPFQFVSLALLFCVRCFFCFVHSHFIFMTIALTIHIYILFDSFYGRRHCVLCTLLKRMSDGEREYMTHLIYN